MHARIFARRLRILSTLLVCFGLLVVGTGCGSPIASVASSPTPSFTASALPTHLASPPSSLSPTPLPPTPTFVPGSYMGAGPDKPTTVSASPHETSVPTMAPEGASYASEQGYFTVTFDRPWKSAQSNALTVTVHEIDEPLILAAMITFTTTGGYSAYPIEIRETPIAGYFDELEGPMLLHRIEPEDGIVQFTFPPWIFDRHWSFIKLFLTKQINLYTLEDFQKGFKDDWYIVYPHDIPRQQAVLLPEREILVDYNPGTTMITIPHSTEGFFQYTPFDAIRDTLTLSSDAILEKTQ